MYNDIHIGPLTLHMYGLMIAIGFISAYLISGKRAQKRGLKDSMIDSILWCAILGGAIGSRILFYIVSLPDVIEDPSILWNFKNGYVVYGGIIGGVLASFLYCRKKREAFLPYFDLVMPSVALAQGFGRFGCFFAGCCYGRETASRFGIVFTNSAFAPNGVRLVPTQLMSAAGDFALAAFLYWYARKERENGRVAALYMILYSAGRFVIEFYRSDYRGSVGPFSTSQLISVAVVLLGILLFFCLPKKKEV